MADSSQESKPCAVCGEKIATVALKCIHCESYQDFRRYSPLSSTILSLIIALISVATLAVPILKKTFQGENSEILISTVIPEDRKVSVFVSNSGTRPGAIIEAFMDISGLFDVKNYQMFQLRLEENLPVLVGPGKHERVILERNKGALIDLKPDGNFQTAKCDLYVKSIDFHGKTMSYSSVKPCAHYLQFLYHSISPKKISGPIGVVVPQ
jgi:hypothetical protein